MKGALVIIPLTNIPFVQMSPDEADLHTGLYSAFLATP